MFRFYLLFLFLILIYLFFNLCWQTFLTRFFLSFSFINLWYIMIILVCSATHALLILNILSPWIKLKVLWILFSKSNPIFLLFYQNESWWSYCNFLKKLNRFCSLDGVIYNSSATFWLLIILSNISNRLYLFTNHFLI